jgi:hypothetical protein
MPIQYELDPQRGLVRTTCVGEITLSDMIAYARGLVADHFLGYPQLIDGRHCTLVLTEGQARELADLMTPLRSTLGKAPVAFVAGNLASHRVGQWYWEAGAGSNRYEVFEEVAAAEVWLAISGGRT